MSMVGTPMLLLLGNESVPLVGQIAVAGVALTAACGSTALLHWCTRPYVHKLYELHPPAAASPTPAAKQPAAGAPPTPNSSAMKGHTAPQSSAEQQKTAAQQTARTFRAELLSIFGRPWTATFSLHEVQPQPEALRPFVSFKAGAYHMFVHGEVFPDKRLLQTLLGRPLEESERLLLGPAGEQLAPAQQLASAQQLAPAQQLASAQRLASAQQQAGGRQRQRRDAAAAGAQKAS